VNTARLSDKSEFATVEDTSHLRNLRAIFWCIALVFGFLQAWNNRQVMNSDGICYLDLADGYLDGGWKMLLNGHWSPFYPWLLAVAKFLTKPSSYWEFTFVHLVNFVVYVFALGAFECMLRQLLASQVSGPENSKPALNSAAFAVIGYLVFLWASLTLITLASDTPDMLMSIFVYLAVAILLKMRDGYKGWSRFAMLGLVLGFGYLAKAPMFPLAFVFFTIALFSTARIRQALPRVLLSVVLFLMISAPLIIGLSRMKGRLTFGDSGKWNYLYQVNSVGPAWYMQELGTARGKFQHPPQKIFDFPPVYAFVGPLGGTLPVWYDPSYWIEGLKPHFILRRQLSVVLRNASRYFHLLFTHDAALMVVLLILFVAGHPQISLTTITQLWPAWALPVAALVMYIIVLVQQRYVAVFLVVLWTTLFSSLRLSKEQDGRRLAAAATFALLLAVGAPMALSAAEDFRVGVRHRAHPQWEIAKRLRLMGVRPGDSVGRIGGLHRVEWARLLRLRVIAEVPRPQAEYFWSSSGAVQSQVLASFRDVGARAIVAEEMDPAEVFAAPPGWQKIGDSHFYVYLLGNNAQSSATKNP